MGQQCGGGTSPRATTKLSSRPSPGSKRQMWTGVGSWHYLGMMLALLVGESTPWSHGGSEHVAFSPPAAFRLPGGACGVARSRLPQGVCRSTALRDQLGVSHLAATAAVERIGEQAAAKQLAQKAAPMKSPTKISLGELGGAWGQAAAAMPEPLPRLEAAQAAPEKKKRFRGIGAKQASEAASVSSAVMASSGATVAGSTAASTRGGAKGAGWAAKGDVNGGRGHTQNKPSSSGAGTAQRVPLSQLLEQQQQQIQEGHQRLRSASAGQQRMRSRSAEMSHIKTAPAKQRRSRGFGSGSVPTRVYADLNLHDEDVALTDYSWNGSDESNSYEDEVEITPSQDALRNAVSAPPGGRLKSRTAPSSYILPSTPSPMSKGQHKKAQPLTREGQEIVRRSLVLTSGNRQRRVCKPPGVLNAQVNPGASRLKKGAAEDDGVVSLSELARRGLIDAKVNTQSVLALSSEITNEVRIDMAVFALDMVGKGSKAQLLTAGSDPEMILWDPVGIKEVGRIQGHKDWINAVSVDHDRGFFCTASDDKSVRVWNCETKTCIAKLDGHKTAAHSLAIGQTQLFVGCQSNIYVWDIATWTMTHRLTNHTHVLRAMSAGKQMSKNVEVQDDSILQRRLPSTIFSHRVGGIVIKKPFLLTAVDDGSVWVWNTDTMEVVRKLIASTAPGVWVRPLKLINVKDAKTGKAKAKLVSGWADGAIRTYDMRTWELEEELFAHNGPVLCLDASDGRLLSTGSDMSVLEWDTQSWKIKRVLRGHRGAVCAVTGRNGETYTASLDGFLKKWTKSNA